MAFVTFVFKVILIYLLSKMFYPVLKKKKFKIFYESQEEYVSGVKILYEQLKQKISTEIEPIYRTKGIHIDERYVILVGTIFEVLLIILATFALGQIRVYVVTAFVVLLFTYEGKRLLDYYYNADSFTELDWVIDRAIGMSYYFILPIYIILLFISLF